MSSVQGVVANGRRWTWNRAAFDACLTAASIGIFAGLAVAFINTPLHLPGHKVLFWMVPAVANRMRSKMKGGATITVTTAPATTLLLGGNLAGGYVWAPLVVLAGVLLDAAIHGIEKHHFNRRAAFTAMVLAGMLANLLCFIKAMANPLGRFLSAANLQDLTMVAGSHAIFGMLAAGIGCGIAFVLGSRKAK